ncbi:MAG TPA: GerMN domain-containing protein [Acidimicrobiales bacterium]|nr:GerMN domain-containing protein [Acidimicrobiales bacterium]
MSGPAERRAPPGGRRRLAPGLVVVFLPLVAAACGVPTQAGPRTIPTKQVPFQLLNPSAGHAPTSPTPTSPGPGRLTYTRIYLVNANQKLYGFSVVLPAPLTVHKAVDNLLASPTKQQTDAGLTSDISDHARLRSVQRHGAVVNLDFTPGIATAAGGNQALAIAQIVFTATYVPGVNAVTISLQGKPVEVPVGKNGVLVKRPVSRADYPTLGPG